MKLDAGGKAIILQGYATDGNDPMSIWLVDDSLDGVSGTVATADIVKIAYLGATFQSTLTGDNFTF